MNTENELYEFSAEVSLDSETSIEPQQFIKIGACFQKITGIAVPEESEDSTKICPQCLGDLKFCFMFQKKCFDSDILYNFDEGKFALLFRPN
jgi:hypothetical protein